jgi:glutamate-5-semialdehyde dehydrogenase
MNIFEMAVSAKDASKKLAQLDQNTKRNILHSMADALLENGNQIKEKNDIDLENGKKAGLSSAMIDRLTLTNKRIQSMAEGLRVMADYKDPIGEIVEGWKMYNDLQVAKVRVPIGVIGMIYESRPNVTVDSAGLALKSGNAIILRGGKEAINSNKVLCDIITEAGMKNGMPDGSVQLIRDTDRSLVKELIQLDKMIDVIIPRGGQSLKKAIVNDAKVPVIVTGAGLCHCYLDSSADPDMALDIVLNGKVQRPGVCNALETILINKDYKEDDIISIINLLKENSVKVLGCSRIKEIYDGVELASPEDWDTEYVDLIVSVKIVDDIDEAIDHINKYGTGHSETIVTSNISNADKFTSEVDAACCYVNASTRFTDGGEFGFGGEIGISTQKLHARGPMGVKELTTTKYVIRGKGQIRE